MREQPASIDRITILPDHIIGHILSLIPLAEAVRTSVLSKPWRRLWTHITHHHLKLGPSIIPPGAAPDRWADVVDSILSPLHSSPISSCHLAPPLFFTALRSLDRFLLILLHTSIKKLHLCASGTSYTIPRRLLHSQTLTDLHVVACQIPPPYPGHHFCATLKALSLHNVSFLHDGDSLIAGLVSSCLLLESLELSFCKGVRYLRIRSTKLSCLGVWSRSPIGVCIVAAPGLTRTTVHLCYYDSYNSWEAGDLVRLLELPVALESLDLDLDMAVTKYWPYIKPPVSSLANLKRLEICLVLTDANTVSLFAFLLRNSPNLEDLHIKIAMPMGKPTARVDFWDTQSSFPCLTRHLIAIKINFCGRLDMYTVGFLKYLVANTPLLKKMYIHPIFPEKVVDILLEKKASQHAEITLGDDPLVALE